MIVALVIDTSSKKRLRPISMFCVLNSHDGPDVRRSQTSPWMHRVLPLPQHPPHQLSIYEEVPRAMNTAEQLIWIWKQCIGPDDRIYIRSYYNTRNKTNRLSHSSIPSIKRGTQRTPFHGLRDPTNKRLSIPRTNNTQRVSRTVAVHDFRVKSSVDNISCDSLLHTQRNHNQRYTPLLTLDN